MTPPDATYLGCVDISEFDLLAPAGYLMERVRLAVTAGSEHGSGAAEYVGMNLATPQAELEVMLERFARVLHG